MCNAHMPSQHWFRIYKAQEEMSQQYSLQYRTGPDRPREDSDEF